MSGANNPHNATLLTAEQLRLTVGLSFNSANTFVATLEVGGSSNRNFIFAAKVFLTRG